MSGQWYDSGTIGSKRKRLQEQQVQASSDIASTSVPGRVKGIDYGSGIDMSDSSEMNNASELSKDLENKDKSDEKKLKNKAEKKEAPKNQRRRMQFMQYMRQENADDRELVKEFGEVMKTCPGWEREDHFEDLRPSIWFRKDQYVVEVYATLGNLAAVFGTMPPLDEGDKQNYTMMRIVFPPVKIPYMVEDEDTGEKTKDFDEAIEAFKTFIEECVDYIREQSESIKTKPDKKFKSLMRPFGKSEDK